MTGPRLSHDPVDRYRRALHELILHDGRVLELADEIGDAVNQMQTKLLDLMEETIEQRDQLSAQVERLLGLLEAVAAKLDASA